MNVTPKAGPNVLDPARPAGQTQGAQSRRDRAMTALLGNSGQPAAAPVQNPTSISPSELVGLTNSVDTSAGQNVVNDVSSPAVPEVKADTRTSTAPEESPLSQHYANLARKERALRAKVSAQEQSIRQREEAFIAREAAFKAKEAEYQSKYISKDSLNQDPMAVLNDSGITYDKLTEMLLNPGSNQPNVELARYKAQVEEQFKAIRDEQQKGIKAQEEASQAQYKQALNQIHFDVKAEVSTNPEFETIHATGSTQDVVNLIERVYKRNGVLLSVSEACNEVEEYLMDEAEKIFKINKIKNKFRPVSVATEPVAKSNQPQVATGMKTLTNAVSSSRKLNSKERAVLAFQGKLGK